MSIKHRVKDALYLWEDERYEGALLNILVAIAATARLRYPNRQEKDGIVFQRFLKESLSEDINSEDINVEFRGKKVSLEKIFYIWLRNMLIHEGVMPPDIKFIQVEDLDALIVWQPKPPNKVLKLSDNWFDKLVNIVVSAPENKKELDGFEYLKICKIENSNKILF